MLINAQILYYDDSVMFGQIWDIRMPFPVCGDWDGPRAIGLIYIYQAIYMAYIWHIYGFGRSACMRSALHVVTWSPASLS